MKDLILLVADKSMQFTLEGALVRTRSLGIRPISVDFRQHPGRDGGVRTSGPQILALERRRFSHALLLLDYEGSGAAESPKKLESILDDQLKQSWGGNAKAIVIVPELETWIWGSDNALSEVLGWPRSESIREWLSDKGFAFEENGKPTRPKEAIEEVVPVCRLPRSAANYQRIARKISLERCQDPVFQRLRRQLRIWFQG